MDYTVSVILIMEIIGTIAFASSGALLATEKNMDLFGVNVLGIVTACGGGLIRDIVLDVNPPAVFQNSIYAIVAVITSTLVFTLCCFRRQWMEGELRATYERIMMVMDTIGLGIFTVVGVSAGIHAGYANKLFLLVFVGTITGVGGGLLRDMMAGVAPYIFVKHIYACASIVGAILCAWTFSSIGEIPAMIVGAVLVMIIRFLAAYHHWNLPRLHPDK